MRSGHLPRRGGVVLVGQAEPGPADFQAAIAIGAQHVVTLPAQDGELMAELSDAAEVALKDGPRGAVLAVIAGRGGAGASVFATALARTASEAGEAMLIDADPWSGGIDLVVGIEAESGLRWPDLTLQGGRLNYAALRDALRAIAVSVCSPAAVVVATSMPYRWARSDRRGQSRRSDRGLRRAEAVDRAAETALESADLVVVIAPADVRSCAAAEGVARWVSTVNPNAGVVVRGPAPGGLRSSDVGRDRGSPAVGGDAAAGAASPERSNAAVFGCGADPRSPSLLGGCCRFCSSIRW